MPRPAAARYLGISERQLARWTSERLIDCVRLPGRLVRYRQCDLDKFLERHRVAPAGRRAS